MTFARPPALRREHLRDALPSSVDLLWHCRASEIPTGYLDDYVALHWLEWHGGGLRITPSGESVRREVVERWPLARPTM